MGEYEYENFRKTLEEIIATNKLTDYMRERLQQDETSVGSNPRIEACPKCEELPVHVFKYFLSEQGYVVPIFNAASNLIEELGTKPDLASNRWYISNLLDLARLSSSFKSTSCKEAIFKVLQKNGKPVEEYFNVETESRLLYAYAELADNEPKDKAYLFQEYLNFPQFAKAAGKALLKTNT